MISQEIFKILTPLQKLPKNVGILGKSIVAKGFKQFPKSIKSPNLVTLLVISILLHLCFLKLDSLVNNYPSVCFYESMLFTTKLYYDEIKHSNWLKVKSCHMTSNIQ